MMYMLLEVPLQVLHLVDGLEHVDEVAAVVPGDLEALAAAVQPIAAQAQRQLRVRHPQLGSQPSQRLQLAVLLALLRAGRSYLPDVLA